MPFRTAALLPRWLLGNAKTHALPKPPHEDSPKLPGQALLTPNELLLPFKVQTGRIKALAGTTQDHFETCYQATLERYARHCQQRPANPTGYRHIGGLLRLGLDTAVAALKTRQGYLLPPGVVPEEAVLKKDLWTFAVFTLALLQNLHLPALRQTVTLHSRDSAAACNPWPGMTDADPEVAGYSVEASRVAPEPLDPAAILLLAEQIIEPQGMAWLASDQKLFPAWLDCLSADTRTAGVLNDILGKAWLALDREGAIRPVGQALSWAVPPKSRMAEQGLDHDSAMQTIGAGQFAAVAEKSDQPVRKEAPAAQFVEWLREGIKTGSIACNTPDARVHLVPEGVLLVTPNLFKDYVAECGGERWELVQRLFLKRKEHVKNVDGSNFVKFTLSNKYLNQRVTGILLKPEALIARGCLPLYQPQMKLDF